MSPMSAYSSAGISAHRYVMSEVVRIIAMTEIFPKAEKRKIRELCGLLYEKELSLAIFKLAYEFEKWKAGKISVWEVSEKIHKFHQGSSRNLFVCYDFINTNGHLLLASAIAGGLISEKEVPEEILIKINPAVQMYSQ